MRDEILMDVLNHVLNKTCGEGWQRVAMDSQNTETNRKVWCRVAKDSTPSELRIRRLRLECLRAYLIPTLFFKAQTDFPILPSHRCATLCAKLCISWCIISEKNWF